MSNNFTDFERNPARNKSRSYEAKKNHVRPRTVLLSYQASKPVPDLNQVSRPAKVCVLTNVYIWAVYRNMSVVASVGDSGG